MAWAAGLFEGEGTITIRKARRANREKTDKVDLQLSSVDKDGLDTFQCVVRVGRVYGPYGPYQANRQLFYKWSVYGKPAQAVLKRLLPFLLSRRAARAMEALQLNGAEYVHEHLSDRVVTEPTSSHTGAPTPSAQL